MQSTRVENPPLQTPPRPRTGSDRRRRRLRNRRRRAALAVAVLAAILLLTAFVVMSSRSTTPRLEIHVRGNQLIDATGRAVRLFGVNRSGTEYSCVVGRPAGVGIFSGPSDVASIAAMTAWHINAVRVPLNEDCWLGINGVNPAYSGSTYRNAITAYVQRLHDAGLIAILDLHWNAPGTALANTQQSMADADHAPAFWTSVASNFKQNPAVMFDLYNEPNGISWTCWQSGCMTGDGWRAVGMQSLIDVVRETGARQPIIVSGLGHANDASGWLSHPLHDPRHQLVVGVHVYPDSSGQCTTVACWDAVLAHVANKAPIVTTEIGERDRRSTFITGYLQWADRQARHHRNVSSIGWAWDAAQGDGGPSLIRSFDGTPSDYGRGFQTYLAGLPSPVLRLR